MTAFYFNVAALLLSATHFVSGQTNTITRGAPCTGGNYCAGGPIILRCEGNPGTLEVGNCNDNLNEPKYGALCVDTATSTGLGGAGYCSAINIYPSTTSLMPASITASPTSSLTLSGSCTGSVASCLGPSNNIIFQCFSSTVLAGNCNDETGEPEYGAICVGAYPTASCSANPRPVTSTATTITTTTSSAITPPFTPTTSLPVTSSSSAITTSVSPSSINLTPGSECTTSFAYCAGDFIVTCANWAQGLGQVDGQPCEDVINEDAATLVSRATCVGAYPTASCVAVQQPTSSVGPSTITETSSVPIASTSTTPSSVSHLPSETSASVIPYTGAAAPGLRIPAASGNWLFYMGVMVAAMGMGAAMVAL